MAFNNFKTNYLSFPAQQFAIDSSLIGLNAGALQELKPKFDTAFNAMQELEKGALANPDEKRMVGHYWLRDSSLAPSPELKKTIDATFHQITSFAAGVHSGSVLSEKRLPFKYLLVIGIGGSALGPQFVNQALATPSDKLKPYFFDNTDADGMQRTISFIPSLKETLCVVISKSGGTKETRNGMLLAKAAFEAEGLNFAKAAVAVTGEKSELDEYASKNNWIARFQMWDWVGGRTSELSAVGLLPAALQGLDITNMLRGAREMDGLTRVTDIMKNPAAILAASWYLQGGGKGSKAMVVLPYSDRLELFSKYLQQLLMESLGKEKDLDGNIVNQGITVYGNKGSTDQHAYVQQLREGLNNFFAVFIEVLSAQAPNAPQLGTNLTEIEVEEQTTSHDYLGGFYQGTRTALYEKGRGSLSIAIKEVSEYSVGSLIALFERAVGLYATLINVNAYHQPGVEAGKKAAATVLNIQKKVLSVVKKGAALPRASEVATQIGEDAETVFLIMRRLAANGRIGTGSEWIEP